MNRSKIYSLSALALILASIGAVSAMWYQSLAINVYVHTGTVAVEWSHWSCNDDGPDPQTPDSNFDNSEGKDVAECIVTPEITNDNGDVIKLNVTIVNAYPGYHADVAMFVDNIGTIPVKLYNYSIVDVDSSAMNVQFTIPTDTQIHPGDEGEYHLIIDVLQTAQQNSTYSFEIELGFAQWNEVSGAPIQVTGP